MSKATAICTCPVCGGKFAFSFTQCNSRACEERKAWLEAGTDLLCLNCYRASVSKFRAERVAKVNEPFALPEIVAVSDKQRAYATDIRAKYIAVEFDSIMRLIDIILHVRDDLFPKAAAMGIDTKEAIRRLSVGENRHSLRHVALTETDASSIIRELAPEVNSWQTSPSTGWFRPIPLEQDS